MSSNIEKAAILERIQSPARFPLRTQKYQKAYFCFFYFWFEAINTYKLPSLEFKPGLSEPRPSHHRLLPAWEVAGGLVFFFEFYFNVFFLFCFFSKLLRVVSSEAFHCARGKKWVTVADLAPLIFHSQDAIHVVSARSLPAPAGDKQAGRTSNRLFTPQCYGGWEG